MIKKGLFWILVFVFSLILSQDYLFVSWSGNPEFLGFPSWLFYFILIQIAFIGIYHWFSKTYWNNIDEEE